MKETIKQALEEIQTAGIDSPFQYKEYHVAKAQVLALIAIAQQMEITNDLKKLELTLK